MSYFWVAKAEEEAPKWEFTVVAHQKPMWLASMRMEVQSLALISGLRILCCCGCGVGQQLQLLFNPYLGTYICCKYGPKRTKKKEAPRGVDLSDLLDLSLLYLNFPLSIDFFPKALYSFEDLKIQFPGIYQASLLLEF